MGSGEVANAPQPTKTMTETLDELCGYYMSIGMPCDEFWNGDYTYFKHYRTAHENRTKQTNQELWLQGLYIYNAFAIALNNSFSKHKTEYMKQPINLFPKPKNEEEIRDKVIEKLNAWKSAFDKQKR